MAKIIIDTGDAQEHGGNVAALRPDKGWRGASLLRGGATIDEVALVLGCGSIDATARMIDFDWRSRP